MSGSKTKSPQTSNDHSTSTMHVELKPIPAGFQRSIEINLRDSKSAGSPKKTSK